MKSAIDQIELALASIRQAEVEFEALRTENATLKTERDGQIADLFAIAASIESLLSSLEAKAK